MKAATHEARTNLSTSPPSLPVPSWVTWVLAALLLGLFAAQNIIEMRLESCSGDEVAHLPAGLTYLLKRDFTLNPEHPPLIKILCAIPLLALHPNIDFQDPAWSVRPREYAFGSHFLYANDVDRLLFWGRLPVALLGVWLGWTVFRWSQRLYGNFAGLFALTLFAFSPNIIAHSHLVTTDLGVTAFTAVSFYFLWRYSESQKRMDLVGSSLSMGAALASKFSAVVFFPVALLLLWSFYKPGVTMGTATPAIGSEANEKKSGLPSQSGLQKKRVGQAGADRFWKSLFQLERPKIAAALVFTVLAGIVADLSYFGSFDPRLFFKGLFLVNKNHLPDYPFYLHGTLKVGGWWYYFIVAFLVKTTAPFVLIILTHLFLFLKNFRQEWRREAFLLFPAFVYFVAVSALADPLGVRYLLPIYPLLIVSSSHLVKHFSGRRVTQWALVVLLAWHVTTSLVSFPYSLSYFNEFVGGPAYGTDWLDDSNVDWGQELKNLKKTLDKLHIDNVVLISFSIYDNPEHYGIHCTRPPQKEWRGIFEHPTPGIYAVSANWVARAKGLGDDWKLRFPILARVGGSIFVFQVP